MLVSSLSGAVLPHESVYFGEIGLSGAIRPVAQAPARLKEAQKLGFAKALMPLGREGAGRDGSGTGFPAESLRHIADLVAGVAASGKPVRGGRRPPQRMPAYDDEDV